MYKMKECILNTRNGLATVLKSLLLRRANAGACIGDAVSELAIDTVTILLNGIGCGGRAGSIENARCAVCI